MTPAPQFVLDASIAITWALKDQDHATAEVAFQRLEAGAAIVPAIWWYEMRNILLQCERRGRITPSDSDAFLLRLEQLRIHVEAMWPSQKVISLARKHALSAYDSAYLGLAMREGLQLATLDEPLARAALAEAVDLVR